MKVALQISGQQRYSDYFAELLESFKVFPDLDVFFHHWHGPRDESVIRSLVHHGQVRSIKIEPQINFQPPLDWQPVPHTITIFNMMSAAYSIKAVNQLRLDYEKETGTTYDLVIRARADIRMICLPQDISWYDRIGRMMLFLPARGNILGENQINDQFAMGKPETINLYAQLFDNFQKFHDIGRKFQPEQILYWHVVDNIGLQIIEDGLLDVQVDVRKGDHGIDRNIY